MSFRLNSRARTILCMPCLNQKLAVSWLVVLAWVERWIGMSVFSFKNAMMPGSAAMMASGFKAMVFRA